MKNPHETLRQLSIAIAKARSNAIEAQGEDVANRVSPEIMPGSLLVEGLERVLEKDEPEPIDVYNILILANRSPVALMAYFLLWQEDLPEPTEALELLRLDGGS